jgi:uncharacterized repeat protein (TIGR01451 family)
MTSWTTLARGAALLAALTAAPLAAQSASPPQALTISARNLMAGDARHAELAAGGVDTTALLPGDVVRYTLRFTNVTPGPVRGVVFDNPIPAGLRFVSGSAAGDRNDIAIAYSIDGGRTYAAQPMIEVEEAGKRVQRAAPPEMYTHVRWTVQGLVQPGSHAVAQFRAALPAARAAQRSTTPADSAR